MTGGRRWQVATAWAGLCVVASIGAVVLHLLAGPDDEDVYSFFYADAVVGAAFPVVGALVVRKEPRSVTGLVLACGGLVGLSAWSHELVYRVAVVGSGSALVTPFAWLAMWTWAGYWVQPTLLPLLFPDGTLPSRRWRPVVWTMVALVAASALAGAFRPGHVDQIASGRVQNPLGLGTADAPFTAVQSVASMLLALPGTALGVVALFIRRRRATGRVRSQLDWLLFGFGTCLALIAVTSMKTPLSAIDGGLFALAFAAIPASIAVAVWRHQLFGVDVVLRRAVAYSTLTALAGAVYGIVVTGAGVVGIGGRVGAPGAAAAVVVASLARSRVRSFVDRRLFGLRHDPLAVVALVNEIGDTGDAVAAVQRVVRTVAEALALPSLAVVDGSGRVVAGHGPASADATRIPVTAEGQQLAELVVGRRPRRGELLPAEHTALGTAAQRIGAILHTDAIARDLQRIRERLVAAQEEERRRLRRELHDGVGPSLAGMALQVETLANRLGPDEELAGRALALQEQLQQTTREIRRLVDGLRPAAVDDFGLREALRQLARLDGDAGRVVVRVPDDLPGLPAAVESGAYRIAAEAVANSLRHGRPTRCVVEVSANDAWLTVEVRDDGCGFGQGAASGVGLQSMHERTSEVGGELAIHSEPGVGTHVVARLPRTTA